jgi:hypothetical protein
MIRSLNVIEIGMFILFKSLCLRRRFSFFANTDRTISSSGRYRPPYRILPPLERSVPLFSPKKGTGRRSYGRHLVVTFDCDCYLGRVSADLSARQPIDFRNVRPQAFMLFGYYTRSFFLAENHVLLISYRIRPCKMLLKHLPGCHVGKELYGAKSVQIHKCLYVALIPIHPSPDRCICEGNVTPLPGVVNNLFHGQDFHTTVNIDHRICPFPIVG